MTSSMPQQSSYFFLPKLKDGSGSQEGIDVKPGSVGVWDLQTSIAFQHVASSLEVPSAGRDLKSVSSIPDIWARPLSMEMALHNRKYPIREQMIAQWQGMLTAIALAEVRGFSLKAEVVELAAFKDADPFARSLYELLPSTQNSLYQLNEKHPWEDLYVFLWNGKPVGMTSPSTLVCPSEEGEWTGLPWWQGGRLRSPVAPVDHLNAEEKGQLKQWLESLSQELNRHNGNTKAINEVSAALHEFQAQLGSVPAQTLKLSTNPRFWGANLAQGPLRALNTPIQAIPQPSSVRVLPSPGKAQAMDLLLIPETYQIVREWGQSAQSIWIHDTINLAALRPEDIPQSGPFPKWNANCLRETDLFLPELSFIAQASAFPGGLLPKGMEALSDIYDGKSITPLLPLNPLLLEYLTPEDLVSMVQVQRIDRPSGPHVEFILDLHLSGIGRSGSMVYRVAKAYPLKTENGIEEIPVLELWPNFRSDTWQEYYGFYYDPNLETFRVNFANPQENYTFKGVGQFHFPTVSFPDTNSNCQLVRLSEFPSFLDCRNAKQQRLGLILLKTPPEVGTTTGIPWKVGVDFGTSFTSVYLERNHTVEPLTVEPLHYQVTGSSVEIRSVALFEYFVANKMELPLSTVLTTRGAKTEEQTLLDGRVFIPRDLSSFRPSTDDWIRTNLKWAPETRNFNRLFLKHLILQITAQAAASNAKEIQWSISYPSAFSKSDRNTYAQTWRRLTQEMEAVTGIPQICPSQENPRYRTESLAVAQYFADYELAGRKNRQDLVRSTCIDVGGGTSDISIWEKNQLLHQCSVQLAGKDLFSQFIQLNPGFLERQFRTPVDEWRKLRGFQFYVKLDILLRRESDGWLRNRRDLVAEEPEFRGLMQLMTLGIAGLYYYVGLLLKALYEEGKSKMPEITPVFIGGNGSRFLNWLAEGGEFTRHCEVNDLFSAMLSSASGFEDIHTNSALSPLPKDEVACGLVLEESHLKGLDLRDEDLPIAGEAFEIDGTVYDWSTRMKLSGSIEAFDIPQLTQLKGFMNNFHNVLEKQRVEGLSAVKGYTVSDEIDANAQLWREVSRELTRSVLNFRGSADDIRVEPPFILGLKALLQILGNRWAEEWK
jgi:hypothetical protein